MPADLARFTADRPCPACGGRDDDPRGQGSRCFGYLSSDGRFVHCTREDHAGGIAPHPKSGTYPHLARGACNCGRTHAPADAPARPKAKANANGSGGGKPADRRGNGHAGNGRANGRPNGSKKPADAARTPYGDRVVESYYYLDAARLPVLKVDRLRDPKSFRQFRPDGEFPGGRVRWVGGADGVEHIPYNLPGILASPGRTVYFCEGEKDADRLMRAGLVATCNPMGAEDAGRSVIPAIAPHFVGRRVVILPDNDRVGREHADAVARSLAALAASVKVLELPGLAPKGDASDWFDAGNAAEALVALADAAPEWEPSAAPPIRGAASANGDGNGQGRGAPPHDGGGDNDDFDGPGFNPGPGRPGDLPAIITNDDQMPAVTAAALEAIAAENRRSPAHFVSGKELVRLRRSGRRPEKELHSPASIRGVLARCASWYHLVPTKNGPIEKPTSPPLDIVADVMSLPAWPADSFLPLDVVADVPIFDRDGRLVDSPGYNRVARIWYEPAAGLVIPPIPDRPSADDLARARGLILVDLLGDFPLADDSSKAHAAGLMILPFVRVMIDGATPPHLISAPTEGTGKTKLADAVAVASTGRGIAPITEVRDDDEWNKRIISVLLNDPTFVLLDNVNKFLDSGVLASAFTSYPEYSGRLLGTNRMVSLPVHCGWILTANNPTMSRELARRFVSVRLLPQQEKPWERAPAEFRHPNLIPWAIANRSLLAWAALVLITAWIARGMPDGRESIGSYERWAAIVGGILEVGGIPGFLANKGELYEVAADDVPTWRAFVAVWWETFGSMPTGSAHLLALCEEHGMMGDIYSGPNTEAGRKNKLGRALKKMVGRCFGDRRLLAGEPDHNGTAQFRLEPAPQTPRVEVVEI